MSFAPYFASTLGAFDQTLGHPIDVGAEDFGPEELGEYQTEVGAGVHPFRALANVRARARARRAARMSQFMAPAYPSGGGCRCYYPPQRGYLRGDEDLDIGGDDDDLAGDEMEIDDLGADDDDDIGGDDDAPQVVGAKLSRIENRLMRLRMKRAELQAKYDATPPTRFRRRRKLSRLIDAADRKIRAKEAKISRKKAKLEARFGWLPETSPAPMGYNRLLNQPQIGAYRSSAPSGAELYIPLRFAGANYVVGTFAAAAAAGSNFAIAAETPPVNFADLQITGIQFAVELIADREGVGGFNPNDIAAIVELNTLFAAGNVNAFYSDQVLPGAGEIIGQTSAPNHVRTVYRMTGLRDNSVLEKNGTAALTGSCEIPISPETATSVVLSGSIICQRLRDAVLDRRAA